MFTEVKKTYTFPMPLSDVEEYVITLLPAISKILGNHHIVLGQPYL